MRKFFHIVSYTVSDLLHQKSFFIMLGVCIGFVLLLRGCYKGNYVVNGQAVDGITVAWHASIIAFHVVSTGVLLIAAILSMNLFRRDREDGTAEYVLSKPVHRTTYVFGRVAGVWLVSFAFMFILHLTIFLITLVSAGTFSPQPCVPPTCFSWCFWCACFPCLCRILPLHLWGSVWWE
jgi:ABC-type transport system involved in multi-copper enzyme maturation permease subunit